MMPRLSAPMLPIAFPAGCNAASADESINTAGARVTGVTQATEEQVLDIAGHRDSVTCIAENNIALWGG